MNAVALISEFERHGIRLSVEAGRILARPKGATPADLAEQARAHKADLVALLSAPAISHVSENELDRLARADGWRPPKEIPPSIVAEIQRIEAEALRLGWRLERLWRFEFWPHSNVEPRGLASVMNEDDAVIVVSKDYVAIGSRTRDFGDYRRFWRCDG